MEEIKTQWHPAFCSAIKLELIENKNDLEYTSEFGLGNKPLLIDLLVITKSPGVFIKNKIGALFKGHNIFEYKSHGDELNIDTFFKTIAYASLYKANGKAVDHIKADDITISFVRESIPRKLFGKLQQDGHIIEEKTQGIYYIHCNFYFDIQVIVTGLLNADDHIWLTSLTKNITERNAIRLVNDISNLYNKDDKEYADSVLQVALNQNMPVFDNIKEGLPMCEALMRLMKPEFDAALDKAVNEKIDEAVNEAVSKAVDEAVSKVSAEKDAQINELKAKLAAAGIE